MPENHPLITIVTSTYNAKHLLGRTADSIRSQSFRRIQWIIADGNSSDGTVDLIKSYGSLVDKWISKRDSGIYQAWNNIIPYADGEWVQFLGAGDELATPTALEEMAEHLDGAFPRYELVYGIIRFVTEKSRTVIEDVAVPWETMKGKWFMGRPMLPQHPEVFHHRSLFENGGKFDERFSIAGDSHFLLKSILRKDPLYVPILVDCMSFGGKSGRIENAKEVAKEISAINSELGIRPPFLHSSQEKFKLCAKQILLMIMPGRFLYSLADQLRAVLRKPRRWRVDD